MGGGFGRRNPTRGTAEDGTVNSSRETERPPTPPPLFTETNTPPNEEVEHNPAAKGVAVVLNRELTNTEGARTWNLIPGKAMLVQIPWYKKRTHTVLAVYAPTESMEENANFWENLVNIWLNTETELPAPDEIAGDFNLVLDPLDRLPHRGDDKKASAALKRFLNMLGMVDGWRMANEGSKEYTYTSSRDPPTHSRIDRIYVAEEKWREHKGWEISDAVGNLSDHKMVASILTAPGRPYIGEGRPSLRLHILHDRDFTKYAIRRTQELEGKMKDARKNGQSPQAAFRDYVEDILQYGIERAKTSVGASREKLRKLQKERQEATAETTANPDPPAHPPRQSPPAPPIPASTLIDVLEATQRTRAARDNTTAPESIELTPRDEDREPDEDAVEVTARLRDEDHTPQWYCQCNECVYDRDVRGCQNPHACATTAANRIRQIHEGWNPDLIPERAEVPDEEFDENLNTLVLPPRTTNPTHGFRVVTKQQRAAIPAAQQRRRRIMRDDAPACTVHLAAVVRTPLKKAKRAGYTAYFGADDGRNKAGRLPAHWKQDRPTAEAAAALLALREVAGDMELTLVVEDGASLTAMNSKLENWERDGWVGVQNKQVLRSLAAELRKRTAATHLRIQEDPTDLTRAARELAMNACTKPTADAIDTAVPNELALVGVQLAGAKQKTLYRAIRETKDEKRKERSSTARRISKIVNDVSRSYEREVRPEEHWTAMRSKDISLRARDFLWRHSHDSFRLGRAWEDIPGCENLGKCAVCDGEEETLQHILFECLEPGQKEIWEIAEELWTRENDTWPVKSIGDVLGCAPSYFPRQERAQ
ncbi:Reverse transcriptase domain-containing protein [Mycena kentingensis (nom. inval.)]|nr:Reverse transcriptase domain-containing protein [Mycena kentingensis (nom. inval.)]